jgi:hypothetical protein
LVCILVCVVYGCTVVVYTEIGLLVYVCGGVLVIMLYDFLEFVYWLCIGVFIMFISGPLVVLLFGSFDLFMNFYRWIFL